MGKSLNKYSIQVILPSTYHSPWCYTYLFTLLLESSGSWLQSGDKMVTGSIIFPFIFWKEHDGGAKTASC